MNFNFERLCARHSKEGEPLTIHKLGRCRRGFKPHQKTIEQRGVSVFRDFLGTKG